MTEQPTQTTPSAPAPQRPPATKALRALPPAKAPAKAKAPAAAKAKAEKPAKAKPEAKAKAAPKTVKLPAEKKAPASALALAADVTEKRLKEIYDLEARVERARERFEELDVARKAAKGSLDDALDALHEEIQAQRVGPGPLFGGTGPR
jgi:membrane protein involved in colicin uptake